MNRIYRKLSGMALVGALMLLVKPVVGQTADSLRVRDDSTKLVDIAFAKVDAKRILGAVSTIRVEDVIEKDNTIWANNVLYGRTVGMLGYSSIRGIGININTADVTGTGMNSGNALFIVDGLPRDIETIRASEIESISVLRDVNASVLYGSAAINGVVLITTKRGQLSDKQNARFSLNYGVATPLELPNYLNSADYMAYYNQARRNDGLSEQYSEQTIANFRDGNPYRYPSNDYYSSEYLSKQRPYFDVLGEFSGGNENAKYYVNLGWSSLGNLINFGDWESARDDKFNVRGNIDLKINDWITTAVDAAAYFASDKGQRGNFWSSAANERPYEYAPLLPIDLINPEDPLLMGRKNDIGGNYLLGGNLNYLNGPVGYGYSGGQNYALSRKYLFNNRINMDLGSITQGLSFHTNISFDYFLRYGQSINNEFSIYEPVWDPDEDRIIELKQHGKDAQPGTQEIGSRTFNRRFGFYGLLAYKREFQQDHSISGNLIAYGNNFKEQGNFQGVKQAHLGIQGTYAYQGKYLVDFSGAYVNSVQLPENNRLGFSPTFGLGWIISEEDFMDNTSWIDWLKVKITGGIINSDIPIGGFYYYDNRYATSGSYNWYEGGRSRNIVQSSWSGNPNLGFVKRKEINLGVEGTFFNRLLSVEAGVFYDRYTDLITRPSTQYPSFFGDFIPYENFGEDEYRGAELGVNIQKSFGEWNLGVAVNALYITSERKKVDEVHSNAYQYRQGTPVDAGFGLEALGFFADQTDINNSPVQSFGTARPGDIKYKDQNNDGIIDNNDEIYQRRWQAPFSGGIQLQVSFKNIGLYVLGAGQAGPQNYMEGNYYWIDGNKKYSDIVLNSWTPETAQTATYPRLSSQSNTNNFRRSSFWLYDNDYFQIKKIQLNYQFPSHITDNFRMSSLKVFLDANDVYQFSRNRKIRTLQVGGEPLYRTFSIGIRAAF